MQGRNVFYSNFLSNHNRFDEIADNSENVFYSNFLSNHNAKAPAEKEERISSIPISYQTTTWRWRRRWWRLMSSIPISYQTTTDSKITLPFFKCLLFQFLIKPQPGGDYIPQKANVFYSNFLSNHNGPNKK